MILLALQLILAHLLGDFVFQPSKWVKDKEKKKHRSPYLYFHILIHGIALVLLLNFNADLWAGILIILSSHYFIDLVKLNLLTRFSDKILFFSDQTLHLLIIAIVVNIYYPFDLDYGVVFTPEVLLFITAVISVTVVSSVVIRFLMIRWKLEEESTEKSLENAGKYIGILERVFVFIFILTDHWEAIGFLIAAKSIFRFGDLSKGRDRKLTEYILIGTFLSFSLAVLIGLLYVYIDKNFI